MSFVNEFKTFIARGNVIDLAVGIIIGAAFTAIVKSLVGDLVMPIIGFAMQGVDFSSLYIALNGAEYESLDAAKAAEAPLLTYGAFIQAVLNFFIVALAVFIMVKQVNRFRVKEAEKPAEPPAPTEEEKLLMEIRDLLKK